MGNIFLKKLKKNPLVLAPMDSITDLAFRELCENNGASYTITELISSDALIRDKISKDKYMKKNLKFNVVQIFGNNPEVMGEASKILEDNGDVDAIDINFGCPSPSLVKNDMGAILLNDPDKVSDIVNKVVKSTKLPVSAKIRLGYKKFTHLDIAKNIEDNGADLLTVHGRTAEQGYSGEANWDAIFDVKKNIDIPVVGNGDVKNNKDLDKLNVVDGLMIGRAAMGNPLIFKNIKLQESNYNIEEQLKLFNIYLNKVKDLDIKFANIRIQAINFLKGFKNSKALRIALVKSKNIEEVKSLIKEFQSKRLH